MIVTRNLLCRMSLAGPQPIRLLIGLCTAILAVAPTHAAPLLFEDVSKEMGITHTGATYGASWGDLNGDGWPDLWVGNHNEPPSLYLNIQGASFGDVAPRVWSARADADTHGAAWADFDNDGDQDLAEVVAATIDDDVMCVGCGENHLFVNQNGRLVESAAAYGVNLRGLARSALWFDANKDGRLDLFVSHLRHSELPGSTVMLNKPSGFLTLKGNKGFHDRPRTSSQRHYKDWLANLFRAKIREPKEIVGKTHHGFAQLADLTGDGVLELINHSKPLRVFDRSGPRMEEITADFVFPKLSDTGDAAVADFDGNGFMDMYFTVGQYRFSQVEQPSQNELRATLLYHNVRKDPVEGKSISFSTAGNIQVRLSPVWVGLEKYHIGVDGVSPASRLISFSAEEARQLGAVAPGQLADGGIGIGYDPATERWTFTNRLAREFVDFVVTSSEPIVEVQRYGFKEWKEQGRDALLLNEGGMFSAAKLTGDISKPTSCHSVVAGDFDNDMDVDIYLACSESVQNLPNRLFLNNGKGEFTLAEEAGGAEGSRFGRSDVVVSADFNNDGFLDLFVANGSDPASPFVEDGPHQLFRNKGNANHYLMIRLEGTVTNRDAIGAQVRVTAGGKTQVRDQTGGMHRFSQDHSRLHFGLANNERVEKIEVLWPDGQSQILTDVAVDQILHVKQASGDAAIIQQ